MDAGLLKRGLTMWIERSSHNKYTMKRRLKSRFSQKTVSRRGTPALGNSRWVVRASPAADRTKMSRD